MPKFTVLHRVHMFGGRRRERLLPVQRAELHLMSHVRVLRADHIVLRRKRLRIGAGLQPESLLPVVEPGLVLLLGRPGMHEPICLYALV